MSEFLSHPRADAVHEICALYHKKANRELSKEAVDVARVIVSHRVRRTRWFALPQLVLHLIVSVENSYPHSQNNSRKTSIIHTKLDSKHTHKKKYTNRQRLRVYYVLTSLFKYQLIVSQSSNKSESLVQHVCSTSVQLLYIFVDVFSDIGAGRNF